MTHIDAFSRRCTSGMIRGVPCYLRRQQAAVTKLLGAFEESTSSFVRSAWTAAIAATLAWQTAIAVKGPDRSFIPLRMSTIQRSTLIFLDWIWNPVGNVDCIFDMFMPRTIVPGFTGITTLPYISATKPPSHQAKPSHHNAARIVSSRPSRSSFSRCSADSCSAFLCACSLLMASEAGAERIVPSPARPCAVEP